MLRGRALTIIYINAKLSQLDLPNIPDRSSSRSTRRASARTTRPFPGGPLPASAQSGSLLRLARALGTRRVAAQDPGPRTQAAPAAGATFSDRRPRPGGQPRRRARALPASPALTGAAGRPGKALARMTVTVKGKRATSGKSAGRGPSLAPRLPRGRCPKAGGRRGAAYLAADKGPALGRNAGEGCVSASSLALDHTVTCLRGPADGDDYPGARRDKATAPVLRGSHETDWGDWPWKPQDAPRADQYLV